MNYLKTKISIFLDYLKDFVIFIVLAILIILTLSTIVHNILRIQASFSKDSSEYKNVMNLENGDKVNVYAMGNGEKTIVILPGFGVQSPVIFYKNLAKSLEENYKVVIIEYSGYGFAQNAETQRTNENIANDIKSALEMAQIAGPYIFMPHSISNLYAMKFTQMYPESVEAIISLDGEYPAVINEKGATKKVEDTIKNVQITSVLEYTGFARVLSYVKPDLFYIDFMKNDENITDSDIKLYRKMIATKYLTRSMKEEIQNLESNMTELKDYQYPENLPVLEILSKEMILKYDEMYSKNKLKNLAQNTISNKEIQKIVEINGSHMLHLSNLDEVVEYVNEFINQ